MMGRDWPDGRSLLDQSNILCQAFNVIGNAMHRFKKKPNV